MLDQRKYNALIAEVMALFTKSVATKDMGPAHPVVGRTFVRDTLWRTFKISQPELVWKIIADLE